MQVWDDSRIEYPMEFAAAHGFAEVQRWPVDPQGKDLSVIKNQTDGPVSLFVHGSREGFMGIWHPHTNVGTAHFAEYSELPAKKIWSWGVDADGLDWRKALSDDNSAYAEVQAGLFRNQETYSFLEPRQHISFSEYWMPVRGIGGISRANLTGVVHLERKEGALEASLNVNQKIPAATLQILDGTVPLFSETMDLTPEKNWSKKVRVPNDTRKYTFALRDAHGAVLLHQTEGKYDWTPESEVRVGPQANYKFPEENARTEDDWLQSGKADELNGDLLSAVKTYNQALQKFPTSYELLKSAGRLDAGLKRFEEAAPRLASAHERNTTDAEISYYFGITEESLGHEGAAIDAFEAAMRSPLHRAAAALRLAEMYARHNDLERAEDLIAQSRKSAPDDLRAAEEQIALLNARGQAELATQRAKELLRSFPSSAFVREELNIPDLPHLAADPYRVLNVAAEDARLGLYKKALQVLSRDYPAVNPDQREPGTVLPQDNPLVVYFRGYCREKTGESGANDYAQASRLSTLYVFPSTLEDKLALEAALRSNSNDPTAHYLLGTWFFARAKTSDALREWEAARQRNPKIPALQASIGLALLHEKHDFGAAVKVFDEGIQYDPRNIVNYSGNAAAMSVTGKSAADRVKAFERYPDLKQMPTPLVYELALSRAEAGNYEGATALFHERFFGREEGGTNVRQVWIEVRLSQGIGLAKTGNCKDALGVAQSLGAPASGLSFTSDGFEPILKSARTDYLVGEVYSACGKKTEANAKYQLAERATDISELVWAWAAAKKLDNFDSMKWRERLVDAASRTESASPSSSSPGWWQYVAGTLRIATGEKDRGEKILREVFLLPDTRLSHHFARLALAGATPQ